MVVHKVCKVIVLFLLILRGDEVYLHNFTYSNTLGITENITQQMSTPSFRGISVSWFRLESFFVVSA